MGQYQAAPRASSRGDTHEAAVCCLLSVVSYGRPNLLKRIKSFCGALADAETLNSSVRPGCSRRRPGSAKTFGMSHRRRAARPRARRGRAAGPPSSSMEIANDLLDGLFAEVAVHLQSADDLAAQSPQVVAVSAQGRTRQVQGQ